MSAKSLEHRIADAFEASNTISSTALTKLLEEVKVAATEAGLAKEEADRVAMDPATRPEAVREARSVSEDAAFRAARYAKAVEGLGDLVEDAKRREADERRRKENEEAIAERDQLAKDLAEWGDLTDKMVGLLTRLSKNNRRLGGNHSGQGRQTAEAIARGLDHIPNGGFDSASIVESTRLMSFNGSQKWPPTDKNNWVSYP